MAESANCIYDLYAVSNHMGTARGGHYTAYAKHPYSGDWHHFNDTRSVSDVSVDVSVNVKNAALLIVSSCVCTIFSNDYSDTYTVLKI